MELSDIIGKRLQQYLNLSEERADIVVYGLDVVLTTLIGYICIIGVSYLLKTQHIVIPMLVTHSILRAFSGGAHGSKYRYCLSLSVIIFNILGLFLKYLLTTTVLNLPVILVFNFVVLGIGLYIIFKKVPVDVEEKPITSLKQRQKLKTASLTVLLVWYGMVFGLATLTQTTYRIFLVSTSVGVLWQIFTLTQVGGKLVYFYGSVLGKIGI